MRCLLCEHTCEHNWLENTNKTKVLACSNCPDGLCRLPKLLGRNRWMIYVRLANGRLLVTDIREDFWWTQTPHEGKASFGTIQWRIDNLWMNFFVYNHMSYYKWKATDLDWAAEKDDEFIRYSEQRYLPEYDDALGTWRNDDNPHNPHQEHSRE